MFIFHGRHARVFLPYAAALVVLLSAGLSLVVSSAALGEHPEHAGDASEHGAEIVHLDRSEREEFGIEISIAASGEIPLVRRLPGEVRINNNRLAHIVPRYAGIVNDVRAVVGDQVRAGQVLAVIESDESLTPYEVKTMISGTVVDKHMTLGEAVSREKSGFVVADLSTVWMDLTVYQRDLQVIIPGETAVVSAGPDGPDAQGTISYVTPVVDEKTRTATARMVVPNPDGRWRPGMFVIATITTGVVAADVVVPQTALNSLGDETVVFVEQDGGFVPRHVITGGRGDGRVEIRAGLVAGEHYVSAGGFTLKAELGKKTFDDGHNH